LYYYIWTKGKEYNEWLYTKDGRETLERINAEA
jgi:ubiquinol-cytochrome c reductase subunit 8